MQRTAIGKIDLETQRKLRFNLVNKAQSVLAYVPGIEINNSTVTGKNQRQAILPDVFETSDVILSNGSTITTKDQLKAYLKRLETAYITANTDLKTSGSQLYSIMLTQQQVAQNETTLTNKLLKKGASMID